MPKALQLHNSKPQPGPDEPELAVIVYSDTEITATVATAEAVVGPVRDESALIKVIDPITYNLADTLLSRIREARAFVAEKFEPIIRPTRNRLDQYYSLRRSLDKPLDDAEKNVKDAMRTWQMADLKRISDEHAAQQAEIDRLEREAQAARMRAEKARTEATAARHNEVAMVLERKADITAAKPVSEPTVAQSSNTRTFRSIRITDKFAFIAAIAAEIIPLELVDIDMSALKVEHKNSPGEVESWPGVEGFDDLLIAGRAGARR